MSVVAAEIAEPPSSGPGFEDHRHRRAGLALVGWTHFLQQRGERRRDGGANQGFLGDVQRQLFDIDVAIVMMAS